MFSDVRSISVLLNVINNHRYPLVPITPGMYGRHFENNVPIEKRIYDRNGDIAVIMVDKQKAIAFFKDRYNFMEKGDITKELNDARSDV